MKGIRVDGRADVFSLGVILFELLTRELPFRADTIESAMGNMLTFDPAPAASARRPAALGPVPSTVDAVVARALEKDREQRFDMAELHRALVAAMGSLGSAAGRPRSMVIPLPHAPDLPTPPPASPAPSPRSRASQGRSRRRHRGTAPDC